MSNGNAVPADSRRHPPENVASSSRSHSRPDGDSIGSQLAFAYALRALGKEVTVVNRDAAPPPLMAFPRRAVDPDRRSRRLAISTPPIIMECGNLARTWRGGARSLLRHQHRSSSWQHRIRRAQLVRRSAAACGEMVFDLVDALGVPLSLRNRDAHLPGDPDRHRLVPLLEHLAAHVRHLPAAARCGRRPGARSRATCTTATTWAG